MKLLLFTIGTDFPSAAENSCVKVTILGWYFDKIEFRNNENSKSMKIRQIILC
jgi:hypothetical protein